MVWNTQITDAERTAVNWKMVDIQFFDPLPDIVMNGATALHLTVMVADVPVGRTVVPCRTATCSARRLMVHLAPFTAAALATSSTSRFEPVVECATTDRAVSIVVCTRHRPTELDRCLASLARLRGVDAQVVVVDNGDDDGATRRVAIAHGAEYVREPVTGLDRARNRGVIEARADLVLFTDDDVEVTPTWARELIRPFADPVVVASTGLVLPAALDNLEQIEFEMLAGFVRTFESFTLDGSRNSPAGAGRTGAGASMAFRRDALLEMGGFTEILDGGRPTRSGGDTRALYGALRSGYRVAFEPRAVVHHHHRSARGSGAATVEGYAYGVVAYLLHGALTTRDPSAIFAAARWVAWRSGLLLLRWSTAPVDQATRFIGRQVMGSLRAPAALLRAHLLNPVEPLLRPNPVAIDVAPVGDPHRSGSTTTVSVVIPTSGRRPNLPRLVDALRHQSHPVEVIVCTDGPIDIPEVDATVVAGPGSGAVSARHRGLAAARGDVVLFLDDDIVPVDDRLIEMHVAAHDAGHTVVVGAIHPVTSRRPSVVEMRERNSWADQTRRIESGEALGYTDVCSGNLSIDRAVIDELGGFGGPGRCEDFDLGLRSVDAGHAVVGIRGGGVRRAVKATLGEFLIRRRHEGVSDCDLAATYPRSATWRNLWAWTAMSRQRRRLMRTAMDNPDIVAAGVPLVAATCRALDLLGSRRRLGFVLDVAGDVAYWSGVGRALGGFEEWHRVVRRIADSVGDAATIELEIDDAAEWTPPPSAGTHLIDVLRNGRLVGTADLRWGGLPFDRRQFSERFGSELGALIGTTPAKSRP